MSTFGWISLLIIGLAFLVPIKILIQAKLSGEDVSPRSLLRPPWKWPDWTWTFPPEDDDPYHDAKLIMVLGGIMMGLILATFVVLVLGTLALVHHLWYIGYPLLVLSLVGCLAMIAFAGFRVWIDFGRPAKRWLKYRRDS